VRVQSIVQVDGRVDVGRLERDPVTDSKVASLRRVGGGQYSVLVAGVEI
jgi:hypothetical protein